jgi:galactitol-specific phosphotransferase system IIC component
MQPERNYSVMRKRPNPIWGFATCALLVVALIIAIAHGRIIEAVIIGVLTLPSALFVVSWLTGRMR